MHIPTPKGVCAVTNIPDSGLLQEFLLRAACNKFKINRFVFCCDL
ncbi:MAG: hypothetical protein RLZZ370_1598 [Bacteroidota bacterium]|jgi:hypothetical protein